MIISEILLRRKHKLNIEPMDTIFADTGSAEVYRYVIAIAKNIESLGYAFDDSIIKVLKSYTRPALIDFYRELLPMLKKLCAADVVYKPMYPNFPQQVASMSDAELYMNAVLHYWSYGTWLPKYAQNARMPLIDHDKITVLSAGSDDDIYDIFSNLVGSKTSLSNQDKDDVWQIMAHYPGYVDHMPDVVPLKENVAMLAHYLIKINPHTDTDCIAKYFKTATDVLRLITSMSGGDVSLANKTQYKHMSRPERRFIMKLLAGCGNIVEDLFRYRDEWIRIGEIVHPWEFANAKYEKVKQAFDVLRNQEKPLFLIGQIEELIKAGDMVSAANLLVNRPGEFARRLDKLLRDSTPACHNEILTLFMSVAEKVSTTVLLQVRQAFISRCKDARDIRVFMPKGSVAKAVSIANTLPDIDEDTCNVVVKICEQALIKNYRQREPMGCVYVNPNFRDFIVPFNQRSASSGNKAVVRGSRIPVREDANCIRAFVWWTNTFDDRVDLDLSACVLDDRFNYLSHISYTRLRDGRFNGVHSGDIVDGGDPDGDGVAEFLDMDINSVVKNGGRYICYQVYSYTQQKFSTLPNCRFGWMEREYQGSGEIFEPKTVEMAIDLKSDSTISVPVIFDCVEKKFIWMDMSVNMTTFRGGNNIESNLHGVKAVAHAIANISKTNLYDLVYLNAIARGCLVYDRDVANIIFDNDTTKPTEPICANDYDTEGHIIGQKEKDVTIITAYDLDYYMSKLL